MKYENLVEYFRGNPRDVHTIPLNGRKPHWFYTFVEGNTIFVDSSIEKKPSCSVTIPRAINKNEFDEMYDIYQRRKRGESVSAKATRTTINQVYWYGILNEVEKEMSKK